jgi:hypothetical protein
VAVLSAETISFTANKADLASYYDTGNISMVEKGRPWSMRALEAFP